MAIVIRGPLLLFFSNLPTCNVWMLSLEMPMAEPLLAPIIHNGQMV